MESSPLSIISWNVNGLQSVLKRDVDGNLSTIARLKKDGKVSAFSFVLEREAPDILALQEIRCSEKFNHRPHLHSYPHIYTSYATKRKGYAGVLVASKIEPLSVHYGFEQLANEDHYDDILHDDGLQNEGRLIVLEFATLYLLAVYTPNSGINGLKRLEWRCNVWDLQFGRLVSFLQLRGKGLVVMGDLNVVSSRLDSYRLDNSKAGMADEERASFASLLKSNDLVDSYRHLHPTKDAICPYSWSYPNYPQSGYRLDYGLLSRGLIEGLVDSTILGQYRGSDHRAISLRLKRELF